MISFSKSRGCVITINNSGGGNGGFAISGFPEGTDSAPILLMDSTLTFKDLVLPVTTLSNKKVLYSFGSDFGSANLGGIICLGEAGQASAGVQQVKSWYDSNSTGNKKSAKPVAVSLGGSQVMSIYVIGLVFQPPDPKFNIVPFTIVGIEA